MRRTAVLLAEKRIHLPTRDVGTLVHFGDGTTASVYRESTVDRMLATKPAVLIVTFRLRLIRGRGHALFRAESILNTPLFIGFPGFVSKLWFGHDGNGAYRGIYQWDDPVRAENYARALWQVLAIGCVPVPSATTSFQDTIGMNCFERRVCCRTSRTVAGGCLPLPLPSPRNNDTTEESRHSST